MRYIVPPTQVELPTISPIAEARISGGMNSRIDPADLPNGISTELRGARTRADYTMRAPGKTLIPGTKPDSLPILMFTEYARFDKTNIVQMELDSSLLLTQHKTISSLQTMELIRFR